MNLLKTAARMQTGYDAAEEQTLMWEGKRATDRESPHQVSEKGRQLKPCLLRPSPHLPWPK